MGLYSIGNPTTTGLTDGSNANPAPYVGRQNEQLVSEVHGLNYTSNYRGKLFSFNRSGVTIPIVATNVASVFTLYNPPNSGVNAEMVDVDIASEVATTTTCVFGVFFHTAQLTQGGTFTTPGTALSGIAGNTAGSLCIPFSAYTSGGTSATRHTIVGSYSAATDTSPTLIHYEFKGKLIVPPGVAIHLFTTSTNAGPAGSSVGWSWMEWPI